MFCCLIISVDSETIDIFKPERRVEFLVCMPENSEGILIRRFVSHFLPFKDPTNGQRIQHCVVPHRNFPTVTYWAHDRICHILMSYLSVLPQRSTITQIPSKSESVLASISSPSVITGLLFFLTCVCQCLLGMGLGKCHGHSKFLKRCKFIFGEYFWHEESILDTVAWCYLIFAASACTSL